MSLVIFPYRLVVILVGCLALSLATPVRAQVSIDDLDPFISSSNVNAGISVIRQYARAHLDALGDGDASARSGAREALREPLVDVTLPSVAFRLAYDAELRIDLQRMIDDGDAPKAINAIYIMGDLGTTQSMGTLISALSSDDESIRYATAVALRRTMEIINSGRGAITVDDVPGLIDTIRQAMERETSVLVVDALVRALEPLRTDAELRDAANIAICQGVVAVFRARATNADAYQDAMTLYRAIATVQSTHMDLGTDPDRQLVEQSGDLAGQTMAELLRVLQNGGIDDSALFDISLKGMRAAETLAGLAAPNLDRSTTSVTINRATRDLQAGGDLSSLEAAVDAWIGPTGLLTRAPFRLNDADFAN
ncbi:MAG: hypothetical protein ACF8GE_00865 [Phycisphaerales bacterium JB043]